MLCFIISYLYLIFKMHKDSILISLRPKRTLIWIFRVYNFIVMIIIITIIINMLLYSVQCYVQGLQKEMSSNFCSDYYNFVSNAQLTSPFLYIAL